MKKSIILFLVLFLCSGCVRIDNVKNIDYLIDLSLKKTNCSNVISNGYTYYLPIDAKKVYDRDYNNKIKINNNYFYLYVDIVSFYHKNSVNFSDINIKNSYYYREVNKDGKNGYINIVKETNNKYYLNILYNYAKIETHVLKEELNSSIINGFIILNSIEYNENLIKNIIDKESTIGVAKEYKIKKPRDAKSKYSEYLSEYVQNEENIPKIPDY